jgi:hypothetical protein
LVQYKTFSTDLWYGIRLIWVVQELPLPFIIPLFGSLIPGPYNKKRKMNKYFNGELCQCKWALLEILCPNRSSFVYLIHASGRSYKTLGRTYILGCKDTTAYSLCNAILCRYCGKRIERRNKHYQGIACTRSFDMGW